MINYKKFNRHIFKIFKFSDSGQMNQSTLIIAGILAVVLFSSFLFGFNPEKLFVLVLAIGAFLLALINTKASLVILIFSMLFSPEFVIDPSVPRPVIIRLDDIILLIICFTWLIKMAVNKRLGLLRFTPLNAPLLLYICVCIISTLLNIRENEIFLKTGFFYTLKYFEYFLLYFMVVNNLDSLKQIRVFTFLIFIVCILVAVYTYPQIFAGHKTSAPFEQQVGGGEPNTLGGYQLLLLAIAGGIFLHTNSGFWQFACIATILITIPSFLYTLSRGSYIGFIFMYLTLTFLVKKKKQILIIILILAVLTLPFILPSVVINRISSTFLPDKQIDILGEHINLEESAAARIETWGFVFKDWLKRPFLGYGVGAKFVDVQFARVLLETGIVGLWIFIWLMITIFKSSLKTLKSIDDDWSRGLVIGFIAAFFGLLIHSFSASTFIIIRVMEPFWFWAAIVIMLPEFKQEASNSQIT